MHFRQANDEFSRSAIASADGPVANAVNVNTSTTSSAGGFQVQIPAGASPGSIIQARHFTMYLSYKDCSQ